MAFQIADDPNVDYKAVVKAGYNRCAANYANQRCAAAEQELGLVTDRLFPQASVLDVGCGAGMPVTQHLAQTYDVMGVDLSEEMITLAQANVPRATFIHADVMAVDFEANRFDAIVSFYAFFHIPRQEHETLLKRFAKWLKPGGLLFVTLARHDDGPGYTEDGFFDVTMYWSNFGPEVYHKMLQDVGFCIEEQGVIGHGYDDPQAIEEYHPFMFCVRHL